MTFALTETPSTFMLETLMYLHHRLHDFVHSQNIDGNNYFTVQLQYTADYYISYLYKAFRRDSAKTQYS